MVIPLLVEIFEDGEYFTDLITREVKRFITAHHAEPFFLYVPYNAVHYPMHAPRRYVERFAHLEPERRMYAAMLAAADDSVVESHGIRVFIDRHSAAYVEGSEIDFVANEMMGSGFAIKNPNVKSSCGCGQSHRF